MPDILLDDREPAEAGASHGQVKHPGNLEDAVADRLGLQSPWRKSPEQFRR